MTSITAIKEREKLETPTLLFECTRRSGVVERWSTRTIELGGVKYEARVVRHSQFDIRSSFDDGLDTTSTLALTLANTDSHFSQVERSEHWKGANLVVRFLFVDVRTALAASDPIVVFLGTADAPCSITDSTVRLSFTNRLSLQKCYLPSLRIQRRCPWTFPITPEQQSDAVGLGPMGEYSPYYRCGYSPSVSDGWGNRNGSEDFTSCDYTATQCAARGMYAVDGNGKQTRRFGGFEALVSATDVRPYGDRAAASALSVARYNDPVPLLYGTAWYQAPLLSSRTSGESIEVDALLGSGPISGVERVLLNDYEIARADNPTNMSPGTYCLLSDGSRGGTPDEPHGSMAVLRINVSAAIVGDSPPHVTVLAHGLELPRYSEEGILLDRVFTKNPAWVMLDALRRSGWSLGEIDLASFARTAAYCDELIEAPDAPGSKRSVPRFEVNLALAKPRSVLDLIRGVRNSCAVYLTFSIGGKLQIFAESTIASQQPVKPESSNSVVSLDGGWPAYEFGDGTANTTGIVRRPDRSPSMRAWCRNASETPNRYYVEFQDCFNQYQQDSYSLVDVEDAALTGQESTSPLLSLGLPSMNQADRIIRFVLQKTLQGNYYIEFETSVRAIGLRPGDIIALTHAREGFLRQPFRVLRISPSENFETIKVVAQIHNDEWYAALSDGTGKLALRWRIEGTGLGIPRPLAGKLRDEDGVEEYAIQEMAMGTPEIDSQRILRVEFTPPKKPHSANPGAPLVSTPEVLPDGGSLPGGRRFYYAVSGFDADSNESGLSFLVTVVTPHGPSTARVRLTGISLPTDISKARIYRGESPYLLRLISEGPLTDATFEDVGLPTSVNPPPDRSYDHANFYWRLEHLPETSADIFGANVIGAGTLGLLPDEFARNLVQIVKGKGLGQERLIASHSSTTFELTQPWLVQPDASSMFVVCEPSWRSGGTTTEAAISILVPSRAGGIVQIAGRAANARNVESSASTALVTRWRIDASSGAGDDTGVPGAPVYALASEKDGTVEVGSIAFSTLKNTKSISAGTLTLHFVNEAVARDRIELAGAFDQGDSILRLAAGTSLQENSVLQVERELLRVVESVENGTAWRVERGCYSTIAATHSAGMQLFELARKVFVLPFVRGLFGSSASGSYSCNFHLPDARIAASEFFVTNRWGDSSTKLASYTNTIERGLRTLAGGQLTIQVEGRLAVETCVAPPLIVDANRSIRDVFATVRESPVLEPVLLRLRVDDAMLCDLQIPPGGVRSSVVAGLDLPVLTVGSSLTADILSVGASPGATSGRDLTITVRL